jgi:hypothetical protein
MQIYRSVILSLLGLMLITLFGCKTPTATLKRPSFEYGFLNSVSAFINTPAGKEILIFIPEKRPRAIEKGMKFYTISKTDHRAIITYILTLEDYISLQGGKIE